MRLANVLRQSLLLAGAAFASPAFAQAQSSADMPPTSPQRPLVLVLEPEQVLVSARRREEFVQRVPVAISVIPIAKLETTGTYNVGQLTQLVPNIQFFSSNPRNTAINIRGLGASFGLTNDGLEAGVGYYVDDVYMSRPAAATFDFLDINGIEVLRGPQGTLFGKNTTAGAITIGIKQPTFDRQVEAEVSGGNYGFWQGKAAISGPLAGNILAARLSASGTMRDGTIFNVTNGKDVNNYNNFAARLQFLYRPSGSFSLRISGDYNAQDSICCAQGFVGVGKTLKFANREFPALAAAQGYAPPSLDPFDRKIDTNTPAQANQVLGGISATANWDAGPVTLTSITAWRTWNWDPANDRDFTRLSIQTGSINPDNQNQYSQELRIASNGTQKIDYVAGLYYFRQLIDARPFAQWGPQATRWLIPQDLTIPVNLLDGYSASSVARSDTKSYAAFAQLTWHVTERLHFTPGLRYTYEDKFGSFAQTVSGGLVPANANELTRKNSIAAPQSYTAKFDDGALAGQANIAYDAADDNLVYATYSWGHKSGGINLAGIPSDANGNPVISTAVIKPEDATTYEIGLKNQLFDRRVTLNIAAFLNEVKNYQVNVVDTAGGGSLRGYLSNADKVSSQGIEVDATFVVNESLSGYLSGAWTEGKYDSFRNGVCPLELIGNNTTACDLSGRPLPGLSKWVLSAGAEYRQTVFDGMGYIGIDAVYRSSHYSDASVSKYMEIPSYGVINLRTGYISSGAWEGFIWIKNLFDADYFHYLSAQPGASGAVFGLLGDPRTAGFTLRIRY